MEPVWIDDRLCTLCGLCVQVCVRRNIRAGHERAEIVDPNRCILCGHCKAVCPTDAPHLPSLDEDEFSPLPARQHLAHADQLLALMRCRRSIRVFRAQPVERATLQTVLEAARFAPSSNNAQPLNFIVVETRSRLLEIRSLVVEALHNYGKRIEEAVERHRTQAEPLPLEYQVRQSYVRFFREVPELERRGEDRIFWNAPALIFCHLDPSVTPFPIADASLATMQMVLMAEALGLGTCLCGLFVYAMEQSQVLRSYFQIPKTHVVPIALVAGYAHVQFVRMVSRRPVDVSWV